jgi:hypothetical protein
MRKSGAGEGIRTLDPNLGKVETAHRAVLSHRFPDFPIRENLCIFAITRVTLGFGSRVQFSQL